jgi:hypothetical protein
MPTKPNAPAKPRGIHLQQSPDPAQPALEDSLPNQEPPLVGAAADKEKQKALQQYRDQTLAESSQFRTDVRRNWKDSANNALHLVEAALSRRKRQVLVDQADSLLASWTGERARDSIIARCQKAHNLRRKYRMLGFMVHG